MSRLDDVETRVRELYERGHGETSSFVADVTWLVEVVGVLAAAVREAASWETDLSLPQQRFAFRQRMKNALARVEEAEGST